MVLPMPSSTLAPLHPHPLPTSSRSLSLPSSSYTQRYATSLGPSPLKKKISKAKRTVARSQLEANLPSQGILSSQNSPNSYSSLSY